MFRIQRLVSVLLAVTWAFLAFTSSGNIAKAQEHGVLSPGRLIERYESASRKERLALVEALIDNRAASIPVLNDALLSKTPTHKLLACRLLGEMRAKAAVPNLLRVAEDSQKAVRIPAINALRQIGDPNAAPGLRRLLDDSGDTETLTCAIYALGGCGQNSDRNRLAAFLRDARPVVKASAALACAVLGDPVGEEVLLSVTGHEDQFVSKIAVKALGYIDTPQSADALNRVIADPNAMWKNYARISLQQHRLNKLSSLSERVNFLTGLSGNKNKWVAFWAVEQLADIDDEEANTRLLEIADHETDAASSARLLLRLRRAGPK